MRGHDVRQLLVIGIGAGDPDYLTVQAIGALRRTDVFFVVEKGTEKSDLMALRREIFARHLSDCEYRVVEIADPPRDRSASAYREAVDHWRRRRSDLYEAAIRDNLPDGQTGAFLVWGDPSIYDSTLAIVEDVAARGSIPFEYAVIPGISSVQALAAKHRVTLNRVGEAIQITTGRRLAAGLPGDAENVVVMLDAAGAFSEIDVDGVEIFWGAYVGTTDELLISGPLAEVADAITEARREARARKSWIMDTYLLRRRRE